MRIIPPDHPRQFPGLAKRLPTQDGNGSPPLTLLSHLHPVRFQIHANGAKRPPGEFGPERCERLQQRILSRPGEIQGNADGIEGKQRRLAGGPGAPARHAEPVRRQAPAAETGLANQPEPVSVQRAPNLLIRI